VSTALAIQATTVALRSRLNTVAGGKVFSFPPDKASASGKAGPFLNLFLYEVVPNTAWRNQEYPSRGGAPTLRPPLALDLRYLLMSYPADDEEDSAHGLLGEAMLALHDAAVLTRNELANLAGLENVHVDRQLDQLKLSLVHLPIEELSKLWTACATSYRLSVVYQASVLLIDTKAPSLTPLPVLQRGSKDLKNDEAPYVTAVPGPALDRVSMVAWGAAVGAPARGGDEIAIEGRGLKPSDAGPGAIVRFRHRDIAVPLLATPTSVTDGTMLVSVPADMPLGFGTVEAAFDLGEGRYLTSNAVSIAVAPRLSNATVQVVGNDLDITVMLAPPPSARSDVVLLFDGRQVRATDNGAGHFTGRFPYGGTRADKLPVRVRVDGVDSLPLVYPQVGQPPPDPPVDITWDDTQTVAVP
jgi:Pvc16 N-terminal domain